MLELNRKQQMESFDYQQQDVTENQFKTTYLQVRLLNCPMMDNDELMSVMKPSYY